MAKARSTRHNDSSPHLHLTSTPFRHRRGHSDSRLANGMGSGRPRDLRRSSPRATSATDASATPTASASPLERPRHAGQMGQSGTRIHERDPQCIINSRHVSQRSRLVPLAPVSCSRTPRTASTRVLKPTNQVRADRGLAVDLVPTARAVEMCLSTHSSM